MPAMGVAMSVLLTGLLCGSTCIFAWANQNDSHGWRRMATGLIGLVGFWALGALAAYLLLAWAFLSNPIITA
jgi:hypothetical protein